MKRTMIGIVLAMCAACGSDPLEGLAPGTGPAVSDENLKGLIQNGATWAYFKNSPVAIARASTSPHPERFVRVRYNTFAATQLDASGRVKANAVFPDSSVIVKELSEDGSTIMTLAVMMKRNGSSSAGFGGWVWAEYTPAGTVRYSTSGRGGACSSCHSQGIDYTRMNDTHP